VWVFIGEADVFGEVAGAGCAAFDQRRQGVPDVILVVILVVFYDDFSDDGFSDLKGDRAIGNFLLGVDTCTAL